MDTLVPFAATEPKTRLDDILSAAERDDFSRAMLLDVCEAVSDAGGDPTVLSTADVDCPYPVVVDDRPLSEAVNARLDPLTAVVMADLALATPDAIERLYEADAEVAIAPGLGGGTNALVVRHPEFRVDYHDTSVRDHRDIAAAVGASTATVDSFRLAVDIDERRDLAEVLLHGEGRAKRWLETAGFELDSGTGRTLVSRA
ncbi:2-phospho-L-lactate guanylyltransferase [Natronomonas amylolytica]|uniref:2-phospho-L-lactate guanylyltransferase n=1 Tax=Natronomonas amylolytica TaxID=3108498 RepID=UPI0030082698